MDTFIIKFQNYLNTDLKKFYSQKGIKINDEINVYYKKSTIFGHENLIPDDQIILEGNQYLDIIKNDEKIIQSISDIINKSVTRILGNSNIIVSKHLIFNINKKEQIIPNIMKTLYDSDIQKLQQSKTSIPTNVLNVSGNKNSIYNKLILQNVLPISGNAVSFNSKSMLEDYLDIIPEELISIIIENIIDNGESYKNFLRLSKINQIFKSLLNSHKNYKKFFHHIADYYSHVNTLPDNVDSWPDLFTLAYKSKYPTKIEEFQMKVRNKIIFKPIEGEHLDFYARRFYRITDVINDSKGLPISFSLDFEDSHNSNRRDIYWSYRNHDKFLSKYYERKATKWGTPAQQGEIIFFNLISSSYKLLLYSKEFNRLIIPYKGLEFIIHDNYFNYLYKVINFEGKDNFYTKIYTEYVGSENDVQNRKLTLIPNDDRTGYVAIENQNITDEIISSDQDRYNIKNSIHKIAIFWDPPFQSK